MKKVGTAKAIPGRTRSASALPHTRMDRSAGSRELTAGGLLKDRLDSEERKPKVQSPENSGQRNKASRQRSASKARRIPDGFLKRRRECTNGWH